MWTFFDDIFGRFDVIDQLIAIVKFGTRARGKHSRQSPTETVTFAYPRRPDVPSGNEMQEIMGRYGVMVHPVAYDSTQLIYKVRKDQWRWTQYLLPLIMARSKLPEAWEMRGQKS